MAAGTATRNSIAVAVRIRPPTSKEAAQLQLKGEGGPQSGHGPAFSGDGALSVPRFGASTSSTGSSGGAGLRRIIRAVDDRVLVFDPADTHPLVATSRQVLGPAVKKVKDTRFCFDRVFDESATQQQVYDTSARELVPGVFDGYNATVFAYGATGCGKTHTISGSAAEPGIIFLLAREVFDTMERTSHERDCEVTLSYLEIYNEQIRDLLIPESKPNLDLREADGKVVVPGLSTVSPKSAQEVISIIVAASANRAVSATAANAVSSRSHAVLSLNIKHSSKSGGLTDVYNMATLTVVDLAGSERASATKNVGERLNEGANINRSLLALGSCINALCNPRGVYVPYRDSKLTRLLKHSLSGNCRTLMIVCVSPVHYDESWNTLQYANRAKEIKTKVTRNVLSIDRHVGQYVQTISRLQEELAALKKGKGDTEQRWRASQEASRSRAIREVSEAVTILQQACEAACIDIAKHEGCDICHTVIAAGRTWMHQLANRPETRNAISEVSRLLDGYSSIRARSPTGPQQGFALVQANQSRRIAALRSEFPEICATFDTEVRCAKSRMELAAAVAHRDSDILVSLLNAMECTDDFGVAVDEESRRERSMSPHSAEGALRLAKKAFLAAAAGRAYPTTQTTQSDTAVPRRHGVVNEAGRPSIGKRKSTSDHVLKSSVLTLSASNAQSRPTTFSRTANPQPEAKKQRKGVMWKDDAGQHLTEEHSTNISFDVSNTSSELGTVMPTTVFDAYTPPAIPCAISTGSALSAARRCSNTRTSMDSLGSAQRARASLSGRVAGGTPRKTVSSTSRRVSGIGVIRSGPLKPQRVISYIDPNQPEGQPSMATRHTQQTTTTARRASRTTVSFENKMAANAEEAARRRSQAAGRSGFMGGRPSSTARNSAVPAQRSALPADSLSIGKSDLSVVSDRSFASITM